MTGSESVTELSSVPKLPQTKVVVNQAWCKKCGICIAFCNKTVLAFGEGNRVEVAQPEKCVSCGICENFCPDYAITLEVEEA
ncbi:4Fe-4S dicluster domain-containing protein [Desulforamulus aeronauticus]|uniref:2-oxoglutarate ferredoxin oxidoreductase subunit delta n=1 Tax=Desulforamulus aeronauticus DSM 10349 TaxID=1121421 RepID=A0A1M6NHW2_9FIRM|nr:2-oxoglutarate ferredoxin oxidoreductase subunit delta [Desulforamulus aeronauticus DSM 10349]